MFSYIQMVTLLTSFYYVEGTAIILNAVFLLIYKIKGLRLISGSFPVTSLRGEWKGVHHPLTFRAQDKAAMQLSELEEEMDQRIQAAEHKTRKDVSMWGSFIQWVLTDRAPGHLWV